MVENPRLPRDEVESRVAALSETLKSGLASWDSVIQTLKNEPEGVQQAAYWLIHGDNPYLASPDEQLSPDIVAKDIICSVAISPDSQTVAGGSGKIVRLWRKETGELLRTFEGHSSWVLSVAISPDGNTLASASADSTIKLWNLKTGQLHRTLTKHSSWVSAVAISPDGQTLISGSADKTINLWDLSAGQLRRTLTGHSGTVCSLAISPDGKILASGSTDKTIKLWDLNKVELLRTLEGHSDCVQALAISPDGKTLVSGSLDGAIKIWVNSYNPGFFDWINNSFTESNSSRANWECVKTLLEHSSAINSISIQPDGLTFISGSDDKTIKLWNLEKRQLLRTLTGGSGFVGSVAISPDGTKLANWSNDWTMLWNLQTEQQHRTLQGRSRPILSQIVVYPSQVRLEFGQSQSFSVRGFDQNGQPLDIGQVAWQATGGTISPQGAFIAGQTEGNFTIAAAAGACEGSAAVTVVESARLTRLAIAQKQVRLKVGESLAFSVRGLDQRGNQMDIGPVSWQATGGEIDTNGTFKARRHGGVFAVTAAVGAVTDSASVTVVKLTELAVSPSQPQIKTGQSQRFTVRGLDQYGDEIGIGKVSWSSTGGTIDSSGLFQAGRAEGNFTVKATVGYISGSTSVTVVEPPQLSRLLISPQQVQMKPEESQRFSVRGLDRRGQQIALGRVVWHATGGRIDQNGHFVADRNAKGAFKVTVTATSTDLSTTADVTVLPVLNRLEVSPRQVTNISSAASVNGVKTPRQTAQGISPQQAGMKPEKPQRPTTEKPDRQGRNIAPTFAARSYGSRTERQTTEGEIAPVSEQLEIDSQKSYSRPKDRAKKKAYTEDSILLYLQEIGQIRLLGADEEIELARQIADLQELERVRKHLWNELGRSPHDSEWASAVKMPLPAFRQRLRLGRQAKDKLVQSNLRLVVLIAKKYMNRDLSFQDLIQEGNLGLIHAAEKFDHKKGCKFSTYASWWIRQAITRALADQSRTIRLPVHLYETISRIKKTTKLLSQEMGRKPTDEEIALRLDMTVEKLRFITKSAQLPISLETPIGKEEDSRLGDFIEFDGKTPEDQVVKQQLRKDLDSVLDTLRPRERHVLRLRYGLDDGRMKTLEEIGRIFGVTHECIRQIETKALRKLRNSNRSSILKDY